MFVNSHKQITRVKRDTLFLSVNRLLSESPAMTNILKFCLASS